MAAIESLLALKKHSSKRKPALEFFAKSLLKDCLLVLLWDIWLFVHNKKIGP